MTNPPEPTSPEPPSANDSGKPTSELDFETALANLERIVGKLEQGQVGLTESLEQYERGVKYLKQCYRLLEQSEKRVEILNGTTADGEPHVVPFDEDHEPNSVTDTASLSEKADNRSKRRSAPKPKLPKSKSKSPPASDHVDDRRELF